VIFILQIAIGIFVFMQVKEGGSLKGQINKGLEDTFHRSQNGDEAARESFNLLQHSVKCCGVNAPADWGSNLPPSCCQGNKNPCLYADRELYDIGCSRKVYYTFKDNMETVGYIALGLCVTELIAAIFALCLTGSIRNERRRGGYA